MNNNDLNIFKQFISSNNFDSYSLYDDINDEKESNTKKYFVNNEYFIKMNKFIKKELNEQEIRSKKYSPGFRYFYWEHYKNNNHKKNAVWSDYIFEENSGYKLSDWFIENKYDSFRDELLNNKIKKLSLNQFNTTKQKANIKLNSWNKDKTLRPLKYDGLLKLGKYYNIPSDSYISLHHIISIMIYCNYTEHSYEFSRTYRKIRINESDKELKQRHREFWHWAKYLRECIELFGNMQCRSKDDYYYHGVSTSMIFSSTNIFLYGPVSTTASFVIYILSIS